MQLLSGSCEIPFPGSTNVIRDCRSKARPMKGFTCGYGATLRSRMRKFDSSGSSATMVAVGNLLAKKTAARPMLDPA